MNPFEMTFLPMMKAWPCHRHSVLQPDTVLRVSAQTLLLLEDSTEAQVQLLF